MNIAVTATTFGLVFLAELPDKTALASLVLATRYRALYVFIGAAAGLAVQVLIALVAGSLLGLVPHRLLQALVAVLFFIGALLLLRQQGESAEEEQARLHAPPKNPWRVILTSFTVVTVAEFGDLTQIVTINLAAKYHAPASVGVGAVLGLWAVAALAILGGQAALKVVPLKAVTRAAALIMIILAVLSAVEAIRG
jgi:Ca2+/H+ antiporter, TMEM165/GDT1 family